VPSISEQELSDLNKILDSLPTPDPLPESENETNLQTPVEEKKLPEWLNDLEDTEQTIESAVPPPLPTTDLTTPPFVGIDGNVNTTPELATAAASSSTISTAGDSNISSEPLPEIDFKLPWEVEEISAEALSQVLPELSLEPVLEPVTLPTTASEKQITEPPMEIEEQVPTSFAEVLNAVAPQVEFIPTPSTNQPLAEETAEPTAPVVPNLKDFRFNYTCVLLPGDRNQFLARSLSEKLGTIMPEIHEDQGWRMTSITIRPQYLLWTVAVPMGVCPNKIMSEVRNLTSNSIYANFPDIAKTKTSNDFWSSKFLAVSGSELPPANLIFEFVSQAWKNPETDTP
jgi:REP element-mobilizing transposase RayT